MYALVQHCGTDSKGSKSKGRMVQHVEGDMRWYQWLPLCSTNMTNKLGDLKPPISSQNPKWQTGLVMS